MDLTYPAAGVLSLLVGLIVTVIMVCLRRSGGAAFLTALFFSLALSGLLLVNWGRVIAPSAWEPMSLGFLIGDLSMIALFSAIGATLGSAPVLGARTLWRRLRRGRRDQLEF